MPLRNHFRRVSSDRRLVEVETHVGDRPVMQREPVEQTLKETVVGVNQETTLHAGANSAAVEALDGARASARS